jgi:hypothetical protein
MPKLPVYQRLVRAWMGLRLVARDVRRNPVLERIYSMAQQWWQPATQDEQAQQAQPVLRTQQEALLRQEQALRSRGLDLARQQARQPQAPGTRLAP